MAIASLILGIVGTVAGVGELGWQVIAWHASGPVVTVSAVQGLPTYDGRVGDPVTCVSAVNSGRSPVTVTSWGLRLPDGQSIFVPEPFPGSDQLPYRLDDGASGTWRADTAAVVETCNSHGVSYEDLHAYVTLGNGRTVLADREGIGLGPGFPWKRQDE